jgi:hypothetical protein
MLMRWARSASLSSVCQGYSPAAPRRHAAAGRDRTVGAPESSTDRHCSVAAAQETEGRRSDPLPEAAQRSAAPSAIDLNALLDGVADMLRQALGPKAELELRLAAEHARAARRE